MKKNLFFTGPIGCGKSTTIITALGNQLEKSGGFLTLRTRSEDGRAVSFSLSSTDGNEEKVFLDFSSGRPQLNMDVFQTLGIHLMRKGCAFAVLDEIGGVELLCPEFMNALQDLLLSKIPCIGVMKGEGPASKLIQALGLSEEYERAANKLRSWMQHNEDTMLYECTKFDETAFLLAQTWAKEYAHE